MTEIILTSGSSWTVPDDCTSATVECIGGGQGGNATNGGNGGDYAKANAVALTPGASIAIAIGAGGTGVASGSQNAGGDTSFGSAVLAKGGGSASTDVGDTTFAGGAGNASGAGGGAAGPNAAGGAASGTTGGQGDGTAGGAGGTSGNAGAAGTEWGTAGSGGGGGAAPAGGAPLYVGGSANYVYPGVSTVPLPAGCMAGDYLVIAGSSSTSGNAISFPAATQILAPSTSVSKYLTVYGYTLTATDIANGYVAASVTYSYVLGVWHAPSGVALDASGAFNVVAQYAPLIAKSVTTSVPNTVLVPIFGNGGSASVSLVPTPYPAGYAQVGEANNNAYRVAMLYGTAASAGATGDISFGEAPLTERTFMVALRSQ